MPYKNKEKEKAYRKKWYERNKEYRKAYQKKWYEENKENMGRYYKENRVKSLERRRKNTEDKKAYDREYYQNNKEKIDERNKMWGENNPEKVREIDKEWVKNNLEKSRIKSRNWVKNHRDRVNNYRSYKYNTDKKYNLTNKMRNLIKHSLGSNKEGRHWEELVGYTLKDLIKRLNYTMPVDYTWKDLLFGELHIDHIIPISAFNFTRPEHTDFKRCWALENLRLLPAKENISKGAKLERPFQPALKI